AAWVAGEDRAHHLHRLGLGEPGGDELFVRLVELRSTGREVGDRVHGHVVSHHAASSTVCKPYRVRSCVIWRAMAADASCGHVPARTAAADTSTPEPITRPRSPGLMGIPGRQSQSTVHA